MADVMEIAARNGAEQEILDFVRSRLRFTNTEIDDHCGVSIWTRENYIRALLRNGQVTKCGRDGATQYFTVWGAEKAAELEAQAQHGPIDAEWSKTRLLSLLAKLGEGAAPVELPTPEPRGAEETVIWDFISGRAYFTLADVAAICPVEATRHRYLSRLKNSKAIRVWGRSEGKVFYTAKTPEEARSHAKGMRDTCEGAMWTAIRHQKRFRPIDLFAALAPARPDISQKQLLAYCRTLRTAGYLRVSARTRHLKEGTPLILLKDTGPLPPRKQSMTVVIDPNEEKIVYAPGGRLA